MTEPAAPPPTAEEPRVRERPVVQEPAREPTTETAPTAETAPVSPRRERVRDGDRNERIRPRDRDAARDDATQEPTAGTTTIQEPAATSAQEVEREPEGIQDVREGRRQRVQDGVTVIEEPGSRIILQLGDNLIIRQDQSENVRRSYRDVRRERRGEIEALVAPRTDGTAIITEVDEGGNLLRRIRRDADGRETVLIDNRREIRGERDARRGDRRGDRRDARRDDRRDPAGFAPYFGLRIDIAPPETRLPRERYIVEYGRVRRGEIIEAFESRPVADMRGGYALDEVLYSPDLRDYMVRVDLDTVTFDTGSWSLTRAQVDQLEELAEAMNAIIDRSPNEIFLVEGHTDAVGRAIDNLSLSDRRAETVAWVLTEYFDVPPENLVTQGYGEEFLKIDTQAAERQNRRVAVRRITPLLAMTP
ncbi:MAG: OmpA family protein [Salinarimonadaceae bacterium]|nr:MAG: OmpA family protein [Salinarimonadaceae bacterium]